MIVVNKISLELELGWGSPLARSALKNTAQNQCEEVVVFPRDVVDATFFCFLLDSKCFKTEPLQLVASSVLRNTGPKRAGVFLLNPAQSSPASLR